MQLSKETQIVLAVAAIAAAGAAVYTISKAGQAVPQAVNQVGQGAADGVESGVDFGIKLLATVVVVALFI